MRITDIKVGEEYRLNYQVGRRGKVIEFTTVETTRGYGWNRKTIKSKRAVIQSLNVDTGEAIEGSKLLKLTGRDIEEEWAGFAERNAASLARQRADNETIAQVERALERVDVDAKVRVNHHYRNNPREVVVTFEGDEAREWFLKVLQAAEPHVAALHDEDGILEEIRDVQEKRLSEQTMEQVAADEEEGG